MGPRLVPLRGGSFDVVDVVDFVDAIAAALCLVVACFFVIIAVFVALVARNADLAAVPPRDGEYNI